ncbi:hypothetical protein E8E14_007974 [Neopestalotiopsis sp. 37M]|nr:hypothetical protein E8E14_007974 [Neopestalotiopsis sp. 37M]
MLAFKDIALWLSAAGANASPDGQGTNLVTREGNSLFFQRRSPTGLTKKSDVAIDVQGSVALIADNQKLFAVDMNNTLRHYVKPHPDSDQLWQEKSLGAGNITVHPESQLCALENGSQTIIFHQDTNGALAMLQCKDSEWDTFPLSKADSQVGTTIAFFPYNGCDHLFYVAKDDRVHRLVRDVPGKQWKDEQFSASKFNDFVSKIVVIPSIEEGKIVLNLFGLSGNKLVLVNESTAEPAIIGMLRGDEFVLGKCLFASALLGCLVNTIRGVLNGAFGAFSGAFGSALGGAANNAGGGGGGGGVGYHVGGGGIGHSAGGGGAGGAYGASGASGAGSGGTAECHYGAGSTPNYGFNPF